MKIPFLPSTRFHPDPSARRGVTMHVLLWVSGIVLGVAYLLMPWYVFLVSLLAVALFATGFIKPEYTFLLVVFIFIVEQTHYFINIASIYGAKLYPFAIPLLATAIGVMVKRASQAIPAAKTHVGKIMVAIALCEAISVIWTPLFYLGLALSVLLIVNLLLFFLPVNIIATEEMLRKVVKVWLFSAVIASGGVIVSQWVNYSQLYFITQNTGFQVAFGEHLTRPAGFAGSDHVGGFISMALFLALGSLVYEKKRMIKAFYALIMVFLFVGIVLTGSRGVIIGLVGAYMFFILMHSVFKYRFIRLMFSFTIIVIVLVLVTKPGIIDRMLIGFGYTGELYFTESKSSISSSADTSTSGSLSGMAYRELMWKRGLNAMMEEPLKFLFGLGNGGFLYYAHESPEVNSITFAFFYDLGVFGLILLFFFLFVVTAYLYRCFRYGEKDYSYYMLLASVSAMIAETGIHGLVDYDLTSFGSKFFWFPMGFVMAVSNMVKKENGLPWKKR